MIERGFTYRDAGLGCAHEYLLPVVLDLIGEKPARILDLGCGNGAVGAVLAGRGHDVWGVDASSEGVAIANQQMPGRCFVMDFERDPLPAVLESQGFDYVVALEVIEHLYRPSVLLDIARRTVGRGTLILSTPYHGYLKNLALSVIGGWDRHHTVLHEGGHIKFWSRATLEQLLRAGGFEPLEFRGAGRMRYFWKSMVMSARVR